MIKWARNSIYQYAKIYWNPSRMLWVILQANRKKHTDTHTHKPEKNIISITKVFENKTIFFQYDKNYHRSLWTMYNSLAESHTYLTISPRRTRRLLRTHRLMRIFSSETVSSDRTMQTVSFRRLPFIRTVSPRNSCSSSILFYGETIHHDHS